MQYTKLASVSVQAHVKNIPIISYQMCAFASKQILQKQPRVFIFQQLNSAVIQ